MNLPPWRVGRGEQHTRSVTGHSTIRRVVGASSRRSEPHRRKAGGLSRSVHAMLDDLNAEVTVGCHNGSESITGFCPTLDDDLWLYSPTVDRVTPPLDQRS